MNGFEDMTKSMSAVVFSVLGEPVTVHREGEPPVAVTGLFLAEHESVDVRAVVPVSTVQPVLELIESDLPGSIEEGDRITVQGRDYLVVDVRPDGYGHIELALQRTSAA